MSFFVVCVVPRIPALEFFHPSGGIDQLLSASPPRMTRGTDGDAELWDRRAGGIGRATRAHNRGLTVRGMPRCPFHKFATSQAALRLYGLGG